MNEKKKITDIGRHLYSDTEISVAKKIVYQTLYKFFVLKKSFN